MDQIIEKLIGIEPNLRNFNTIACVCASVSDYVEPVVNENYVLVKIDRYANSFHADFLKYLGDIGAFIPLEFMYFIGFDTPEDMDGFFDRASVYLWNSKNFLQNCYCQEYKSIFTHFSDFTAIKWHLFQDDFDHLEISASDIEQLFGDRIFGYSEPDINDHDIQMILNRIKNSNCLMKGISEYKHSHDSLSTSLFKNSYSNGRMLSKKQRQQHEMELVENLLKQDFYPSEDLLTALADLTYSGKDTNVIELVDDHRVALFHACHAKRNSGNPCEILLIKLSNMDIVDELNYPMEDDCVLYPIENGLVEKNKHQGNAFLYCTEGILSRGKYAGIIESVLIPETLIGFFLNYSNLLKDINENLEMCEFLNDVNNFKTSVMGKFNRNSQFYFVKRNISSVNSKLMDFDTILFLNLKMDSFYEFAADGLYLTDNYSMSADNLFARTLLDADYSPSSNEAIGFLMGCNLENFDLLKFDRELKTLLGLGANPIVAVLDMKNDQWSDLSLPIGDMMHIDADDLERIVNLCLKP